MKGKFLKTTMIAVIFILVLMFVASSVSADANKGADTTIQTLSKGV